MRDIAVHRDLDGVAPRPTKAPGKRPSRSRGLPRFKHWSAVRRYGSRALLWSSFAALMGVIVVNATALQKGHHPAPLIMLPEPSPVAAAVPAPAPRVAADGEQDAPAQEPAGVEPAPVPDAPSTRPAPPVPGRRDGIAQMLKGATSAPAAKLAAVARPRPTETRTVPKSAATVHPAAADRNRLAAMMGAVAAKGHATVAN